MSQLLIAVRLQGYFLQLLINRQSNLRDLVKAMRQNQFIKGAQLDQTLQFYNANDQKLTMEDSITKAIINEKDRSHRIQIKNIQNPPKSKQKQKLLATSPFQKKGIPSELLSSIYQVSGIKKEENDQLNQSCVNQNVLQMEMQGENANVSKFFQQKTNKILQKILYYLQKKNYKGLMKTNTNNRIDKNMKKSLYKIGEHFMNLVKLKDGLDQCLSRLCMGDQKSLKQINKIKQEYNLPEQKCLLVDDLVQKISKARNSIQVAQMSKIQQDQIQSQMQKIKIQFEKQSKQLKQKIKILTDQNLNYKHNKAEKDEVQDQLMKTQKIKIDLKNENNQIKTQIDALTQQNKRLSKKLKDGEQKLKRQKEQIEELLSTIKTQKTRVQAQNKIFKQNVQQLQMKYSSLENQLSFQKRKVANKLQDNQKKIDQYQSIIKQHQVKLKNNQENIIKQQKIVKDYQFQITSLKQNLIQVENKNKQLQLNVISLQRQFSNLKQMYRQLLLKKQYEDKIGDQLQPAHHEASFKDQKLSRSQFLTILQKTHQLQEKYLLLSVQSSVKKKILNVSKLFRYQNQKMVLRQTIHDFIDGRHNILLIARTAQKTFGAFSQNSFSLEQDQPIKSAFMFSQIKGQFMKWNLINGSQPLTYDSDYLIYGNQEIKIANNSLQCYSMLSSGHKFQSFLFNSQNKHYYHFLSDKDSQKNIMEVTMLFYEIYEVTFSDQIFEGRGGQIAEKRGQEKNKYIIKGQSMGKHEDQKQKRQRKQSDNSFEDQKYKKNKKKKNR